ncbi:MAG: hypothetical protein UH654_05140 [Lachnospiraceae bacterium]|nr:hypothetical protein [Lachnospiraceae bacterium]MEE0959399.1 hypothetical protein [Lachnospiraceae bacterium]
MKYVFFIIALLALWILSLVFICRWTIKDGKNRHLKYELWTVINALLPVIGFVLYSIFIRRKKICRCRFCGESHDKKLEHCPNCGAISSDEDIIEVVGNNPAPASLLVWYFTTVVLFIIVFVLLLINIGGDVINFFESLEGLN